MRRADKSGLEMHDYLPLRQGPTSPLCVACGLCKEAVGAINRPIRFISNIPRKYSYRFCFLFLLVGLLSPTAHVARADGGAPQLAYVAGTAQGIGVIDIARRRVTGSI